MKFGSVIPHDEDYPEIALCMIGAIKEAKGKAETGKPADKAESKRP